jgi:chain length determinant protein EpsF
MNIRQVLRILALRWWLVALISLLVVGGAAAYLKSIPKSYEATATVLLDFQADPLVATLAPTLAAPNFIATQVEIFKSDRLAGRVVKVLNLADNQDAIKTWREATQGRVPIETFFGERLKRGLVIEPTFGSTVISVTHRAPDAKFAATVANAFARAYIDLTVELRLGPAREYATFFDERARELRLDLEKAQQRLGAFQKEKGIVVTGDRLDVETARLNSLEVALASAFAESADTSVRLRNSGNETSVDVQQSAVVQGLKGEIARAETKLNEVSTTLGASHPARIQLEAQISELKQQLASEMRRVSGATTTVNRITNQKIAELRSMVENQKRNVLALRAGRDEANVLLKDVETAQRAYEQVAQRRAQLANESQAEQASARILSQAVEPLWPSSGKVFKNMVAAVIIGLGLGIAAAVLWEMLDRRIRNEDDMHMVEGVPVLGTMSTKVLAAERSPRRLGNSVGLMGAPRLPYTGGTS